MSSIVFASNADTEFLTLRGVWEDLPEDFPSLRTQAVADAQSTLRIPEGTSIVIIRLLGGSRASDGLGSIVADLRSCGAAVLCFPGEAEIEPELVEMSSVSAVAWHEAFSYLVKGGHKNYENFLRFVVDTTLGTNFGYEQPEEIPPYGIYRRIPAAKDGAPRAVLVFYRAHLIAGNTAFVDEMLTQLSQQGLDAYGVYVYSLRNPRDAMEPTGPMGLLLGIGPDVVITTVWAAGFFEDETSQWVVGEMQTLGVPVIQGLVSTQSEEDWRASEFGLSPTDVAMSVAIPEFDGRIISFPFVFKELLDDDEEFGSQIYAYRTSEDRSLRLARLARNFAFLKRLPNPEKKIAIVLSAYPTKKSRLGNAVGLDTPVSTLEVSEALRDAGYWIEGLPEDADDLMALLGETLDYHDPSQVYDVGQRALSMSISQYVDISKTLPERSLTQVTADFGPAPGTAYIRDDFLIFPGIRFGNLLICIQPPRGFGDNPIAIYHSAELAPTHHYLAFYRYLEEVEQVNAIIHLGKHGTLEWLPGKSIGMSEECFPDIAIGALPVFYPFVINDPGEGTQAKRRMHATIIGHLIPPMTRAETYGDLSVLESLLDEHQRLLSMDPTKLPRIREQIWEVLVRAEISSELGLSEDQDFHSATFDGFLGDVDGYLCEIKDALIRGGLHTLGRAPSGQRMLDLISAIMRTDQGAIRSLRDGAMEFLGIERDAPLRLSDSDAIERLVLSQLELLQEAGWDAAGIARVVPSMAETLKWVGDSLVPRICESTNEIANLILGLNGGFVPPGPSGSPTRGMTNTLPTGRNFYSIDPRATPTRLSYEVGEKLAQGLIDRYLTETGGYPKSVGMVIWGTAAMRTGGDDVSQVLALVGVRPKWDEMSGRVVGLEAITLEKLGRPRIDVTCRISGFFRDAFPQAIKLVDDAFALVESLEESSDTNFLKATRGQPRIFGPPERAYGSGVLPLLESKKWDSDKDIAEVYLTWGGHSYSHGSFGKADRKWFEVRLGALDIASKNQDNREHDIFDSDDYLQDHGGMIAAARVLSGRAPKAYFGDSSRPSNPVVRDLKEEASKVIRSRVVNPKWISAMMDHGYKGAFEMAATVDYVFGYDATAQVVEDWMYESIATCYVGDAQVRKFFSASNPTALGSICERLLEAHARGMWNASDEALSTLREGLLEAESWEEE